MEPAISIILEALAVGAQSAAKDVATNETKRIYDWLKSRIQQKWVGKPDAETLLTAYAEGSNPLLKEVLAQKLEESAIHQDKDICRQAEKLIQEVNASIQIADSQVAVSSNKHEAIDLSRKSSSGDTVTHGASLDKSTRSVDKGTYYEGSYTQIRQTRLAVLIGLLSLALVGVVFYLIKTGKIQLPKTVSLSDSSRREDSLISNSEQVPSKSSVSPKKSSERFWGEWKLNRMYPNSCHPAAGFHSVKFFKDRTGISSTAQVFTYKVVDEKSLIVESSDGSLGYEYSFSKDVLILSRWDSEVETVCSMELAKIQEES